MRKYLSFFRIRFIAGVQYRAAAWAGIATQFAWGGMTLLMFWAFYQEGGSEFPMRFDELSSYIWLQQAFLALYMAWYFDEDIFSSITSGSIAYELCRPMDLYNLWFTKNLAHRLSSVILRCVPILLVAAILPAPFGMRLPATWENGVMALISMALGLFLLIAFSMLIYISAFFTLSAKGLRVLSVSVIEFFAGAVIPIPFFPAGVRELVMLLPFASMQSTPFLIYVGQIRASAAFEAIGLQLFWLLGFCFAGRILMRLALKRVVVQGG